MTLNRANTGFTGTANISVKDELQFEDVILEVVHILHKHQMPHGDKAPVTIVHCENGHPLKLSLEDIETLKKHGFQ